MHRRGVGEYSSDMETPRVTHRESIWLVGKPRFLREALGRVLAEKFAFVQVRDIADTEPPALALNPPLTWLVWFLSTNETVSSACEKIGAHALVLNFLMIQNNGHAFAHWANHNERHFDDISLSQVIALLGASLAVPDRRGRGETHATHTQ